jgi:hypothetical protein
MKGYLQTDYPSIIFLFHYEVNAIDEITGRKLLLPLVKRCEQFAKGLNIHFHDDCFLCFDDKALIRLVFQIKENNYDLLLKSSTLLSFALSANLTYINHESFKGTR